MSGEGRKKHSVKKVRSFSELGGLWRRVSKRKPPVKAPLEEGSAPFAVESFASFMRGGRGDAPGEDRVAAGKTDLPPAEKRQERGNSPKLRDLDELVRRGIGGGVRGELEGLLPDYGFGYERLEDTQILDLHGYTVAEAMVAFENFLRQGELLGRRKARVIHGRGLSSPGAPVLKIEVRKWLERAKREGRIAAFAGAEPWNGGEGAVDVYFPE